MNDIDDVVRAGLGRLADELATNPATVRPERIRERHRRRRRAHAGILAVTVAVIGIGLGVPAATGWLAAAPAAGGGSVAGPGGAVSTTSAAVGGPTDTPADPAAQAAAAASARALAALAARQAAAARAGGLDRLYTDYLAVHECLTAHGYTPTSPVGREAFLTGDGTGWTPYDGLSQQAAVDGVAVCPLPADR